MEKEKIILKNTFIMNFTNISTSVVYNSKVVTNVINIFPENENLYFNTPIYENYNINFSYDAKDNANNTLLELKFKRNQNNKLYYDHKYLNDFDIKRYNNLYLSNYKIFYFKILDIKFTRDIINYFLMRKVCGFNRLKQISGTCWANSILNSLLLSSGFSFYLKKYYNKWIENLDEKEKKEIFNSDFKLCLNTKLSFEKYLIIIIYNILIKKIKPSNSNANIIAPFAANLKMRNLNNDKTDIKSLEFQNVVKYSNGGNVSKNLNDLYSKILGKKIYLFYDNINEQIGDKIDNYINKNKKIITIFYNEYLNKSEIHYKLKINDI